MPTPTPRPTPRPSVAPAVPTFFDLFPAEVRIVYYEVSGTDPSELLSSMYAGGPWSDWLNQRAIGQTRAEVVDAVGFRMTSDGSCQVVPTDNPAITYRFTVTLPHWTPPAGADPSTVSWWTSELEDIATHEAHHVLLYRNSEPALNAAVASSTCYTLSSVLQAIVDEADRNNCLFDLAEYGFALGLTEANCY
jgi:predicted secreted Zn-dependent protease